MLFDFGLLPTDIKFKEMKLIFDLPYNAISCAQQKQLYALKIAM